MKLLFYMGEFFYSLGYLEKAWKLKQYHLTGSTCVCTKAQSPSGGNTVLLLLLKNNVKDEVVRVE